MQTNLTAAMLEAIKTGTPKTLATAKGLETRKLGRVSIRASGWRFQWRNREQLHRDLFGSNPSN